MDSRPAAFAFYFMGGEISVGLSVLQIEVGNSLRGRPQSELRIALAIEPPSALPFFAAGPGGYGLDATAIRSYFYQTRHAQPPRPDHLHRGARGLVVGPWCRRLCEYPAIKSTGHSPSLGRLFAGSLPEVETQCIINHILKRQFFCGLARNFLNVRFDQTPRFVTWFRGCVLPRSRGRAIHSHIALSPPILPPEIGRCWNSNVFF